MPFKRSLFLLLFALMIGPLAAFSSHLFLVSLDYVTLWREAQPHLIWTLPLLGILMTFGYKYLPTNMTWGVTHLLFELREPRHRANPFLSVWIFLNACLTHLGGGSVGREGVGLIINGSLIDGISPFKEDSVERSILLQAALSAGFTGMFGTPLAGILFIFEINDFRFSRSLLRWAVIITSVFSTYFIGEYIGTPHQFFPKYVGASWSGIGLMFIAVPVAAYSFYYCFRFFYTNLKKLGQWHLPIGGLILSLILFFLGTRYSGLGSPIITLAVTKGEALPWDWILKIILTSLTIGIGYKGGEVTPLFFIGATLGAAVGSQTGDLDLAKIGMVSILGCLTHTPLAAGVLASELFGAHAFTWAFLLSLWGKLALRGRHLYRFD